jgi:hypothetical protein
LTPERFREEFLPLFRTIGAIIDEANGPRYVGLDAIETDELMGFEIELLRDGAIHGVARRNRYGTLAVKREVARQQTIVALVESRGNTKH